MIINDHHSENFQDLLHLSLFARKIDDDINYICHDVYYRYDGKAISIEEGKKKLLDELDKINKLIQMINEWGSKP